MRSATLQILLQSAPDGGMKRIGELLADGQIAESVAPIRVEVRQLESLERVREDISRAAYDALILPIEDLTEFKDLIADPDMCSPVLVVGREDDPRVAAAAIAEGAQEYLALEHLDRPRLVQALLCARQRARRLREMRCRERRKDHVLESAVDGIWQWDIPGERVEVCPRWTDRFGKCREFGIHTFLELIHPEDRVGFKTLLLDHVEGRIAQFRIEHRLLCQEGEERWVLSQGLTLREQENGRASWFVGSMMDITKRKQEELRILHAVYHDSLTGLPNRAHFMRCLERAIARRTRRRDHRFAVLFLDLDRFKPVNDRFGHLVGDQLLIEVARRLEACVRPGDTAARLAGDEFTLLLDDINDSSDAFRVADRIQEALASPIELEGVRVSASASIGITLSDHGHVCADDFLKDADSAMYKAKSAGSSRSAMYHTGSQVLAEYQLDMESGLSQAMSRNEFVIQYQPIVTLDSELITGFEALLRWRHPVHGLLGPREFIPLADKSGLLVPIGFWMIRESLKHLKRWRSENGVDGEMTVSVNLSIKQLCQAELPRVIRDALQRTGLEGSALKLEISERDLMGIDEDHRHIIDELDQIGVQFSIDDFGTGYTSLGQLHGLPIESLKIDRSLVLGIDPEGMCSRIVQTIVALAKNLGVGVIAEGVETAVQRSRLRALHCAYGQGRLFHSPLDQEAADALVTASFSLALPAPMAPEPIQALAG